MTDPTTTNLGLTKPTVGADADTWGTIENANKDIIDGEYQRIARGDANYTILSTDRIIIFSAALTAPRTFTLPAASAMNASQPIVIIDMQGGISATNTLTIARAGSDTINGAASFVVSGPYAVIVLRSNGGTRWTADCGQSVTALQAGPGATRQLSVDPQGRVLVRYDDNTANHPIGVGNLGVAAVGQGTGLVFNLGTATVSSGTPDPTPVTAFAIDVITADVWNTNATTKLATTTFRQIINGTLFPMLDFISSHVNPGLWIDSYWDLRPHTDGGAFLGASGQRWSAVYAVVGTIQTSDARQKDERGEPTDVELDAWEGVRPAIFRWKALASEGDRLQAGYIAQQVEAAFALKGLDAADYGLWRRDEQPDGTFTLGLLYNQCAVFEAACLRRRLDRAEARLTALEAAV